MKTIFYENWFKHIVQSKSWYFLTITCLERRKSSLDPFERPNQTFNVTQPPKTLAIISKTPETMNAFHSNLKQSENLKIYLYNNNSHFQTVSTFNHQLKRHFFRVFSHLKMILFSSACLNHHLLLHNARNKLYIVSTSLKLLVSDIQNQVCSL